jgi:hypothetical protein
MGRRRCEDPEGGLMGENREGHDGVGIELINSERSRFVACRAQIAS